jgi:hypothetical protein
MPNENDWIGEKIIQYKVGDLKEDIDELKHDMKEMSIAINKLTTMNTVLNDYKQSLDMAWKEIRDIQNTCTIRQHHIDWIKAHEHDETPQGWWDQMVSSVTTHGVWIIISVVIATIVSKTME